jgi:hypothetical protein
LSFFACQSDLTVLEPLTPSQNQSTKAETLDAKRWFEANQQVIPIGEEAMKMAINFREIQPNWQTAARHGRGIEVDFVMGNKKIFPQNKQEDGKQGRVHLLLMKSRDKGYVPYLIYYLPSKDFVGNIDRIHYGNYLKGAYKGDVVYNRIGATNFRCLRIEGTKIVRTGIGKMPNPNKPEGSCFTGWLCFYIQVWDSNKNEWVTVLADCEPGYEWCDDCDPGNVDAKPEYCYQPCDVSNPDRPVYCEIDCNPANSTQPAYCTDECDMSNPSRPPTCDGGDECAGPNPPTFCNGGGDDHKTVDDEEDLPFYGDTCPSSFNYSQVGNAYRCQVDKVSHAYLYIDNHFNPHETWLSLNSMCINVPMGNLTPQQAADKTAQAIDAAREAVRDDYTNAMNSGADFDVYAKTQLHFQNALTVFFMGNCSVELTSCQSGVTPTNNQFEFFGLCLNAWHH